MSKSKLTARQIGWILESDLKQAEIAEELGVSQATISHVKRRAREQQQRALTESKR